MRLRMAHRSISCRPRKSIHPWPRQRHAKVHSCLLQRTRKIWLDKDTQADALLTLAFILAQVVERENVTSISFTDLSSKERGIQSRGVHTQGGNTELQAHKTITAYMRTHDNPTSHCQRHEATCWMLKDNLELMW